jgi:outer membrane protein OmpA-like peptidoglycan-associated protein
MSIPRILFVLSMLAALTATAAAQVPKAAEHRDPNAPCYAWPSVDYDQDGVFDRLDRCPDTPKGCVVDEFGCSVDSDGDGVCDGLDQCPDTPKGEKVNHVGCGPSQIAASQETPTAPPPPPPAQEIPRAETPTPPPAPPQSEVERQLMETGTIVLRDVHFDYDKAIVLPESQDKLDEAGGVLEKFASLKIEVQGHTDSRGTAAYNMKLSQARADAVRDYLLKHFNLNGVNYVTKGYGKSQLEVSPEKSEEDYLLNRRVVLKVLNPEALPQNVKIEEHK